MLNITDHQENKNQNHNEIPPNIHQEGYHQQNRKQQALGRNYAGGPVAKTSQPQRRRPRFHLPSGNWIPHATAKGLHTPTITRDPMLHKEGLKGSKEDSAQPRETTVSETGWALVKTGARRATVHTAGGMEGGAATADDTTAVAQKITNRTSTAVVQSLSRVRLFATRWSRACQASLSFTISRSLLKLMSVESAMPSNHFSP